MILSRTSNPSGPGNFKSSKRTAGTGGAALSKARAPAGEEGASGYWVEFFAEPNDGVTGEVKEVSRFFERQLIFRVVERVHVRRVV